MKLQLEKAREATDAANIRAAYAEVVTYELTGEGTSTKTVTLTQQTDGWDSTITLPEDLETENEPKKDGTATVEYNSTSGKVKVTYSK